MSVEIPDHIEELIPYRPGKPIEELARERSLTKIVKLASNENPLGPSPLALKALKNFGKHVHRYPNPGSHDLVAALAQKFDRRPEEIICAHGSDSLLSYAIMAFTREGEEILTSQGTFIGLEVNARKLNRKLVQVPLKNYHYDLREISRSIYRHTRIVYLANPNNPTGSMFSRAAFEAFLEKVPENCLVILDEAYTLFAADNPFYPNGLDYPRENLLVMRTFSKDYGLAGLRVGFAFGPEKLISQMYKVKLPFEPNMLAQVAACAALNDDAFLEKTKKLNEKSLKMLMKQFQEWGMPFIETAANFLMVIFSSEESALNFHERCMEKGLILRPLKSFGIPNAIRINSGTLEETAFAIEVMGKIISRKDVPKSIEKTL